MMIFDSKIRDIFFNLALENYILTNIVKDKRILLTYINSPCVVIGRFQNPWIECNLKKMYEDGIQYARRQSGGGTVYHDENNINYSIIAPKNLHNKDWNFELMVKVLSSLGIKAKYTDRGDIRIDDKNECKISGSAFKEKKDTAFHHGTMLIDSDIEKLNLYIHSNKDNLVSKSIASKRSTVTNLKSINKNLKPSTFLVELYKEFNSNIMPEVITTEHELYSVIMNSEYYKSLCDLKWKYLETPKFFVEEIVNELELSIEVRKTLIEKIEINSSKYHPVLLNLISESLTGVSLFEVSNKLDKISYDEFKDLKLLKNWFISYFELDTLP